jgi:hypothetical protein
VINWTLTEGVAPDGAAPGELFWEVTGDDNDPHDARHFPSESAAVNFLFGHKMKRNDTLHYAGADTGRVLRIGWVKIGDVIEFDCGSVQIPNPAELVDWVLENLQKGDTISYLPEGS